MYVCVREFHTKKREAKEKQGSIVGSLVILQLLLTELGVQESNLHISKCQVW